MVHPHHDLEDPEEDQGKEDRGQTFEGAGLKLLFDDPAELTGCGSIEADLILDLMAV